MWRLWLELSVVFPFQQLGNTTSSSSASSSEQLGAGPRSAARPPTPPQLQETTDVAWRRRAVGFPATIFSPAGGATTEPVVCFVW